MNENDLSCFSYKELQALAHTYRVPGNIKKQLLVRVLQAIQGGNELEVDRMLLEVQQTRKKRVKKQKPNIMTVSSTPMHSPNYRISDDCYYARHQLPYQWVGAEEEIAVREENNAMSFPNYTEFQQFLLQRIQRDQYPSYNLMESEVPTVPSIVDLRMGAGSSVLRPIMIDNNQSLSNNPIDQNTCVHPASEVELQILEDTNENNQRPLLLKRMLEAPVGANLGEIASPDTNSQKIWSLDHYPNRSDNPLDDSDTLTAESEYENDVCDNDNNNNHDNDGLYYRSTNDTKNQSHANNADILSKNTENMGQLRNNFSVEGMHQYPLGYPVSDVQANCQKWIAANSYVNREVGCVEQMVENPHGYNPVYYENTPCNSTITGPINLERKYQYDGSNEDVNYEANQTIVHGQRSNWSNEYHPYYQSNNTSVNATGNPNQIHYGQEMARQLDGEVNHEYFIQRSNNVHAVQNSCHTVMEIAPLAQFATNVYNKDVAPAFHHQQENNNGMQYNSGYYSQYPNEYTQALAGFSIPVHPNQQQQQQETSLMVQQGTNDRKNNVEPLTAQPISNGILDSFWPQWPISATPTLNGNLEIIMNLHNRGSFDYSKRNETSSVYCYTEPIMTQRIEGTRTWSTRNKPLTVENRQHLFAPNRVVYNDASTGLIMANIHESSNAVENQCQEQSNDGPSNSSGDQDYELRPSSDSSDSSINDVWIHDYASYPVSSDNALQSADLTNDENDDDLFSTVREASQNSIDDHTIETFNEMNY